jgi:hypothetical protein
MKLAKRLSDRSWVTYRFVMTDYFYTGKWKNELITARAAKEMTLLPTLRFFEAPGNGIGRAVFRMLETGTV